MATPRVVRSDLVAAVVVVAGAVALFALGGLAPPWGSATDRDASFWPFAMLLLLVVLGTALGIQSVLEPPAAISTPERSEPARERASRTIAVLAYVPALFLFGFYVSALAYAFALPPLLGGVRWRTSAAFALLFAAVLYAVFTVGLRMDLPQGYIASVWASVDTGGR
jgi:hypothetical protein